MPNISKNKIIVASLVLVLFLFLWFFIPKSRVTLEITPNPYRLIIDGKSQNIQTNGSILLAEGDHTYYIESDGYRPVSGSLSTKNFSNTQLEVDLKQLTTIEKEYKKLLMDFPGTEVYKESQPQQDWLVIEFSQGNNALNTQTGIYHRVNSEWNLVVRGSSIFSSAELADIPSSVQDWLFTNGYIMNDDDELGS